MKKTIAKALREKKTIAKKIATSGNRAVVWSASEVGIEKDFDYSLELSNYREFQSELRELKTMVAKKTIEEKVSIPASQYIKESGTDVPLFKAILIRDDLKSYLMCIEQIIARNHGTSYNYSGRTEPQAVVIERNFNLQAMLDQAEEIQSLIDTIDASIQYVDNTKEI